VRRSLLAASALLLAVALLTPAARASAATAASVSPARADTVVVILTPFLTWDDLSATNAPELRRLAEKGAIGNMNSLTGDSRWPTVVGGALTLSASRWTAGPLGVPATPERIGAIRAANADSLNPPDIGALGEALHAAGLLTAAVGNSDGDTSTPEGTRRPAALVAFDHAGDVDFESAAPSLLVRDPDSPECVHANRTGLLSAVDEALAANPALLVIDPGDLGRAHDATGQPPALYARSHDKAVRTTSAIAGDVAAALTGRRVLLLVVTPATDKPYYEPPYFGPTIAVGGGFVGRLTSESTHRPGLVTNLDVAPTILAALDVKVPPTMLGQAMTSLRDPAAAAGSARRGALDDRIAPLALLGASVGAIDYTRDLLFLKPFAKGAAWLVAALALLALVPALRALRPLGRGLAALGLAVPAGAWLLFAVNRHPETPTAVLIAFFSATAAIFAVVLTLSAALKKRAEIPLLALSALTSLLIFADQLSGNPLESGLFSYSIRAGWRYYGMGNEGAALLVGASIIAVGLACDLAEKGRWERMARFALMPAVGVIVLTATAAPFAGANAGAAIWGSVAFGVAWAQVNGVRMTPKSIGAIALGVCGVIAAIVLAEATSDRAVTHIGRFFIALAQGDFAEVRTLVVRKALNNYNYIPQTPYTQLAIALALALAATYWLADRPLARALKARPGVAAALLGLLAGGIAAALTEDSGVVMPALMLFAGTLPALSLALLDISAEKSLDPDVT
jgi:hypothetical protein